MIRQLFLAGVVATGLMLSGCGREEEAPTPTVPTAPDVDREGAQGAAEAATQTAAGAAAAGEQAVAAATEQASTLIDEARKYIEENKYDLAEKAVNQLDGMKGSLPQSMQDQIASLKTLLQTRKAAQGVNIPGM